MKVKTFKILLIIFSFFLSAFSIQAEKKNSLLNIEKLTKLKIPSHLGTLDEIWIPKDTHGLQVPLNSIDSSNNERRTTDDGRRVKIILHIRDAHCIYEAQLHIAQLIKNLTGRYDVKLVCLEGSVGKLDPSILTQYTSPLVRKEVLDGLMRQGRLTGPEYAAVILNAPITIYGIEDETLYEKNVQAFKTLVPQRDHLTSVFNLFEHQLQDLEPHISSPELKELRALIHRYDEGQIQVNPYGVGLLEFYRKALGSTKGAAFSEKYPNAARFIEQARLEKEVDFKKVDEERTQFLSDASAKLKDEELNELVSKSLKFRLDQISALEYYIYLEGVMRKSGMSDLNVKCPNLVKFIAYEKVFGRMDSNKLFDEFDAIRDSLLEKTVKTPEEKAFLDVEKAVKILRRLYHSELNRAEMAEYLAHKERYSLDGILAYLKENSKKYGVRLRDGFYFIKEEKLKNLIPSAEDFYNAAEQRNSVLTDHLFKAMEAEGADVAILVAGGFHTEAIKKIFKEKGVAYAVVTPAIEQEVTYNPYVKVISGEKDPLEKFLEVKLGARTAPAPSPLSSATRPADRRGEGSR